MKIRRNSRCDCLRGRAAAELIALVGGSGLGPSTWSAPFRYSHRYRIRGSGRRSKIVKLRYSTRRFRGRRTDRRGYSLKTALTAGQLVGRAFTGRRPFR